MNLSFKVLAALCAGAWLAAPAHAQEAGAKPEKADSAVKLPQVLNILQQHKKKIDDAKARNWVGEEGASSNGSSSAISSFGFGAGGGELQSTNGPAARSQSSSGVAASSIRPATAAASVPIPIRTVSSPAITSQGEQVKADVIPVVPVSVVKNNVPASIDSKAGRSAAAQPQMQNAGNSGAGMMTGANDNPVLVMKPGVNQIIPIAVNHPNRIVTPFANPEVVSTSLTAGKEGECGEICIKDNVVYVATEKLVPVTMFITNKGSEAQALSLTMLPRRVPPREVFLKLDGAASAMAMGAGGGNAKAEAWESSQPYIETLRTAFRKIALNEIPPGYTLTQIPAELQTRAPRCAQQGMPVDFSRGQYMAGHNINIFIGVAINTSSQPLEFKETLCGNWDVAAVTSWPLKVLEPGQRTEVYVAVKQASRTATTSQRPSLIGGR